MEISNCMGIHIVIHITDKLFFFLYTMNATLTSAAHPKPSVLSLFSLKPTSSILSPNSGYGWLVSLYSSVTSQKSHCDGIYTTLQILHWLLSSHHLDLLSSANRFSASFMQFQSLRTGLGSERLPLYFLGNSILFCPSSPSLWLLYNRADIY